MALARWQATIVDAFGNVLPSASVEVRRETAGAPLASLYSNRDGSSALGNPFSADAEGFAAFHVAGGAYRIDVSLGGFSRTWRYVAIGLGGESDLSLFTPMGAWDIATTYETGQLVSHDDGGEPYSFVSNVDSNLANEPQFDTGIGISDANWTVVGLGETGLPGSSDVVGTSASSVSIGTGTKTFTVVENSRGWGAGARLRVSSDANPTTHWMEGVITSYSGNTLQITSDLVAGSGSRSDWTINLAGEPGEDGDLIAANNLSDVANAATARGNLSAAAKAQTDFVSGLIPTVADQAYKIVQKIPYGCTVTALVTRCTSGTCTLTGDINGTPLGGTANAVSTSEQEQAHASANTVAAGDDITLTASANAACVNLSFTLVFTRTLA